MLAAVSASKNDRYLDGIATTPNQDYFPKDTTWEWQMKLTGNYELPYKINTSASYTMYNGVNGARTFIFTGIPSASTVTLRLEPYGASKGPVRDLLNVKIARDFSVRRNARIRASVEILNALNSVSPWSMTFASGPNFLYWGTIDSPRIARGSVSVHVLTRLRRMPGRQPSRLRRFGEPRRSSRAFRRAEDGRPSEAEASASA